MNTPLDLKSVEEAVKRLDWKLQVVDSTMSNRVVLTEDDAQIFHDLASLVLKASEVLPKEWSTEYTYPGKSSEYTKGEVNGANKMLDDCRLSFAKACIGLEEIVNNEPELPGDMPAEMFNAIKNDKEAIEKALRIAVKSTKKNIICAIQTSLTKK